MPHVLPPYRWHGCNKLLGSLEGLAVFALLLQAPGKEPEGGDAVRVVAILVGELSISLLYNESQEEGFGPGRPREVCEDLAVDGSGYDQDRVFVVDVAVCHFEPVPYPMLLKGARELRVLSTTCIDLNLSTGLMLRFVAYSSRKTANC